MQRLRTLKVLEDELGQVLKSGLTGQSLYYSAHWEEIRAKAKKYAKREGITTPGDDVRLANEHLTLLGIPNHYSEAGVDEKGNWIIYWR
jgi:hypothetical protein